MLEFTAYGSPAPKGSVKSFIPRRKDGSMVMKPNGSSPLVVKTDDSGSRGKVWGGTVATSAAVAMREQGVTMWRSVPLAFVVDFYQPRPQSHYRTGRNAGILRDDAPTAPAKRPDVDKLLRAVLDALKNVAYGDDGQVVAVVARKNFGEPARAEIRVGPFAPAETDAGQMALAA